MTIEIRLFTDENWSSAAAGAIRSVVALKKDVRLDLHDYLSRFQVGTPDRSWIDALSAEGRTILTCDLGKRGGGVKLPDECQSRGIKHVLFAGSFANLSQFYRARAVVVLWDRIESWILHEPDSLRARVRKGNGLVPEFVVPQSS